MEIWPARLSAAVGVNTTEMEQFAPGATLAPQVLVWEKFELPVPVTTILVILKAADPELLNVTLWAALPAPTLWVAKVRECEMASCSVTSSQYNTI